MPARPECSELALYAMVGQAPTDVAYQRRSVSYIAGSGIGNKSFSREGFVGQFYFGQHVDFRW